MRRQPCNALLALGSLFLSHALPAAENFRLVTGTVNIPERGAVTSYVLLAQSNKFSFLPRPDWRATVNADKSTVTLTPRDLLASISFKLIEEERGTTRELQPERLRQQVLDRFPRSKIISEFACRTSNRRGVAFDLERIAANKSKMSTRIAFVAYPGVTVEFTLTAPAKNFADYHLTFGNLLTSFRMEAGPPKDKP